MSLEEDEEQDKALLVAVCEKLRNNDPFYLPQSRQVRLNRMERRCEAYKGAR